MGVDVTDLLLALLGTPCGGTEFMSRALARTGLDVGHEHPGEHGISCGWFMWSAARWAWDRFSFEHAWRIYRDPLRVLETLPAYVGPRTLHGRPPLWAHEDPQVAALRRWVLTHELIEPDAEHTVRVGEPAFGDDWRRLCNALGRPVVLLDDLGGTRKPTRWPRPSWGDLEAWDAEYHDRARKLVEVYG